MLNPQDLFNFGVPSAKDADYLSSNKMSESEKSKLYIIQLIGDYIRAAALTNKGKTDVVIDTETMNDINDILEVKQLLEQIGYDISLEVVSIPLATEKIICTFYVNWEM